MKFLVGLILGSAISIGIMSKPEPRHQLLELVTNLVEKMKQFPPASMGAEARDTQPITPPATVKKIVAPGHRDETQQTSRELRPVNTAPIAHEPGDETIELASRVNEENDVPVSTLATSLFQVAWSPFRSETSARGFAATLEHQVSQKFQVIKTGPGIYEVGFHFESGPERSDVLNAINEITGFQSTVPPRIVNR